MPSETAPAPLLQHRLHSAGLKRPQHRRNVCRGLSTHRRVASHPHGHARLGRVPAPAYVPSEFEPTASVLPTTLRRPSRRALPRLAPHDPGSGSSYSAGPDPWFTRRQSLRLRLRRSEKVTECNQAQRLSARQEIEVGPGRSCRLPTSVLAVTSVR